MEKLHPDVLREIMPNVGTKAEAHAPSLEKAMAEFGVTTPLRRAAFLAQVLHETLGLAAMVEGMNYKAEALIPQFNRGGKIRFTPETAQKYGRTADHPADQRMIGNLAYANRMGNGGVDSGDGFKYRGRGAFHLTGRDNYEACGKTLKLDLLAHPELVESPDVAARSAGWFWLVNGLNTLADAGDIVEISKRINGGTNGLAERISLYKRAKAAL